MRNQLRVALLVLTMPLISRVPGLAGREARVCLRLGGLRTVVSLWDHSEWLIIEEIWLRGEYRAAAPYAAHATTILDLGANIGLACLWFRQLNPTVRIIAVEPDPLTFAKLRRNVGADPRVLTVNAAVAAETGVASFVSTGQSWGAHLASDVDREAFEVATTTLDDLLTSLELTEIDIIKMDIEGAEWDVLSQSASLGMSGVVIGELHPPAPPGGRDHNLATVAGRHGFRVALADSERHFMLVRE